jgi:hypothetical protein
VQSKLLPARSFNFETEFRQLSDQGIAVLALNLDRSLLYRSACSAAFLQLRRELFNFSGRNRQTAYNGHSFSGTPLRFAAYSYNAVAVRWSRSTLAYARGHCS